MIRLPVADDIPLIIIIMIIHELWIMNYEYKLLFPVLGANPLTNLPRTSCPLLSRSGLTSIPIHVL